MTSDVPVPLLLAALSRELPDLAWKQVPTLADPMAVTRGAVAGSRPGGSSVEVSLARVFEGACSRPRWRLTTSGGSPTWPTWAGHAHVGLPPGLLLRLRELAGPPPEVGFPPAAELGLARLLAWSAAGPGAAWGAPWLRGRLGGLLVQVGWARGALRVAATWRRGSPRAGWSCPGPIAEATCDAAGVEAAVAEAARRALEAARAARAVRLRGRAEAARARAAAAEQRLDREQRRLRELEHEVAQQPGRVESAARAVKAAVARASALEAGALLAACEA